MAASMKLSRLPLFAYKKLNFVSYLPLFRGISFKKEKYAKCTKRIFSGIQPTGVPHLGNYVGAIKQWIKLQEENENVIFSIVDMHAITVPQNPEYLRNNIRDMLTCLLACGLDPDKSIIFQQSSISQHAELAWILSCLCTLPRIEHLPQWKQKSEQNAETGLGLFTYPVLQAADILLYRATDVPVGEDQLQHIELAHYLARAFNNKFGIFFPKPEAVIGEIRKIRSLRKPSAKMSKSETDPKSRIELTDSPDIVREKVKKAVTDFTSALSYDPVERPGVSNLIDIHAALTDTSPDEILEGNLLLDTGEYKKKLADVISEHLKPIQSRIQEIKSDKNYVNDVLSKGNAKAREIAETNYGQIKKLVGFS